MRDFFISAFEKLVGVIVVLMSLAVLSAAVLVFFDNNNAGPLMALGVVIVGALYVVVTAGMLYLFLGIHNNTKRAAEALERAANQKV